MAIRILTSEKSRHRNNPTASISLKLKRLSLNKEGCSLLAEKYGSEPEYLQILVDDDLNGIFWIKPCDKDGLGAKKLDAPSRSTRSLHISMLLKQLKWTINETSRFELQWDEDVQAARIDTNQRLDDPKDGS